MRSYDRHAGMNWEGVLKGPSVCLFAVLWTFSGPLECWERYEFGRCVACSLGSSIILTVHRISLYLSLGSGRLTKWQKRIMELEEVKFRRSVQAIIALTVRVSEVGKFWWGKYLHDGYGYWWVTATGFSLFDEGGADTRNEALWSLALALLAIDFGVQWIFHTCGARTSKLVHVAVALLLGCLSIADLALTVGAGGARVSLPLVLFAITECGYVFRMVRPWLHYVVMSLALLISLLVLLSPCLRQLGKVAAIPWRMPWVFKLALAIYCGQSIWNCRRRSEGVGSDMLSQLGSDAFAMMMGKCFPAESREALSSHGTAKMDGASIFPPLLIFHWEAGADILLDSGPIANATPFLHHTLARPDVFAGSAIASVPVTLKTAWEVLCGVAASSTSDFREQGSSLRLLEEQNL
eukprot:symbB.v1.2.003976.t1/scaffold170.1/size288889/22